MSELWTLVVLLMFSIKKLLSATLIVMATVFVRCLYGIPLWSAGLWKEYRLHMCLRVSFSAMQYISLSIVATCGMTMHIIRYKCPEFPSVLLASHLQDTSSSLTLLLDSLISPVTTPWSMKFPSLSNVPNCVSGSWRMPSAFLLQKLFSCLG